MKTYDKHDPEVAGAYLDALNAGIPDEDIKSIEIDELGFEYITWIVRNPRKWAVFEIE